MKKIILLLTIFSMVFTSCEPLEDINAIVDAQEIPIVGDVEYTLTADDYADLDEENDGFNLYKERFDNVDDVEELIPGFLSEMFPVWGKNSSVLVHYQLFMGYPVSVEGYNLAQDNYTTSGSDLMGFASDAKPEDFLLAILDDNISYLSEGKYVIAKYFQYTGSAYTVTPTVSLEDNFDYGAVAGDITTASAGNWVAHSSSGYRPAGYGATSLSMTDYPTSNVGGSILINNPGNEDVNSSFTPITSGTVYYSALVNLSTVDSGTYFIHFMEEDGSYNYAARVGAKDNGTGKILFGIGASSSSLTYGTTAFDLDTTYLLVASYDIATGKANLHVLSAPSDEPTEPEATNTGTSGYSLERIGVRQGGGGPNATIDGIRIANTWSALMSNEVLDDEVIGEKVAKEGYYMYSNGSWGDPDERFYFVSDADFDSMGEEDGRPGADDTFGSSIPPSDYLAVFLNLKFPYANEGDELDVTYDYESSSSGPQVRGELFTFNDGQWSVFASVQSASSQFGHDGNDWIRDNTIKYTLVRNADYEYMASQLTGNADFDNVSLTNLGNYGDFDYNWSDAQINYALNLFLDYLDPNAAEGQKYLLTYVIYDNGENDYNTSFIKQNGAWVVND